MTPPGAHDNPASLGAILHEKRVAGRPVLWTESGLAVPPALEHGLEALLQRLEAESDAPIVLTALGNTEPGLNPFADLDQDAVARPDGERAAQLVGLLGPGFCHEWNRWPPHIALLSASAADVLAQSGITAHNAVAALREAGGRLLLSDSLFLHDP
ncbi:MAG: hypothetical protein P8Y25_10280, partial [Chromatiaceae bacterium]